jgi:aspartate 1-decarboxylase
MQLTLLKSKIHRATITEANLNYVGSITIDRALMREANIHEHEQVHIVDIDNGNRLETYVIPGEENSGTICLNGAAARLVQPGDKIIIMTYCTLNESQIATHLPKVVIVDKENKITETFNYEKHGDIK